MVMPVLQRCSKCQNQFMGADAIGRLCGTCEGSSSLLLWPDTWDPSVFDADSDEATVEGAACRDLHKTADDLLLTALEFFQEMHREELDNNHFGDVASGCSYCEWLHDAREYLQREGLIDGSECRVCAVTG